MLLLCAMIPILEIIVFLSYKGYSVMVKFHIHKLKCTHKKTVLMKEMEQCEIESQKKILLYCVLYNLYICTYANFIFNNCFVVY